MIKRKIVFAGLLSLSIFDTTYAQICPTYQPPTNGCSTPEKLKYLAPALLAFDAIFSNQCTRHDICYGTLGTDRASCDNIFRSEMKSRCDSVFSVLITPAEWHACRNAADGYYYAVDSHGAEFFGPAKQRSANWSYSIQSDVVQDKCGTTPGRTLLYSSDMLSYVENSFLSRAGRSPSVYEFFYAINSADPAGDSFTWRTSVDQYSTIVSNIQPPAASYTLTKTWRRISLVANPNIPGVIYKWYINGQVSTAPGFLLPLNYPTYNNYVVTLQGFMTAQKPDGAKNLVVIDERVNVQATCPNGICP